MKRAQSAIEFMILIGAMVLLMTGFFALVGSNFADKQQSQKAELVRDTAILIQEEIRIANTASDGYERVLILPDKILGKNYTITIIENLMQVQTIDLKHSLALPIANINGTLYPGTNTLRKVQGVVYANN